MCAQAHVHMCPRPFLAEAVRPVKLLAARAAR